MRTKLLVLLGLIVSTNLFSQRFEYSVTGSAFSTWRNEAVIKTEKNSELTVIACPVENTANEIGTAILF